VQQILFQDVSLRSLESSIRRIIGGTALAGWNAMLFRQLFDRESSTYTYLLDPRTGEALLIDRVVEG